MTADAPLVLNVNDHVANLYTVTKLLRHAGFRVAAASPGLGRGTTMTVRLPLRAADPKPAAEPEPARPTAPATPASGPVRGLEVRSVLVVDDNEDGREMLRCLCELYGHQVVEAGDGEAGVARAIEARPDIAFIDIGLPTIDGYEVARRVRAALGAETPRLVALSGYGSDQHKAAARDAGFDIHISKPINAAQLRRELAAAAKP